MWIKNLIVIVTSLILSPSVFFLKYGMDFLLI